MLPIQIKKRFGLTVDTSRKVHEPCPICGGTVCRVVDNNDDAFCINPYCSFRTTINHSYYDIIIEHIEHDAKFSYNLYIDAKSDTELKVILFDDNAKYRGYSHPVMFVNDLKNESYIIRNLRFDDEKWKSIGDEIKAIAGLTENHFVDADSPVIAQYFTLQELVEDGWTPNRDRDID